MPFDTPEQAVDWLVAVQSQDFFGAKWALGLRLKEANDETVEQAFNDGRILRTHLLRPTWHFVTPQDIHGLLALTAPRVHTVNSHMYRKMELDAGIFARSEAAMIKALQGGKQFTRDEIRAVLEQAGVATRGEQRLVYLLMHAELEGVLCSGPRLGKQFSYMLLDERVSPPPPKDPHEALAELTLRYFRSRGPATVQDYAKWSGLTLTQCKNGVEVIKGELQSANVTAHTYYFTDSTPSVKPTSPRVDLLSIYDEYISGYKDHSPISGNVYGAQMMALGNALTYILIIDGQIAGSWRRTLHRQSVQVELNPFRPLTDAEVQATHQSVQQYGAFLGLAVELDSGV